MISRVDEPQQLYAQGGLASLRQPYGFGSFVKKAFKAPIKAVKKVAKSPIGKAALLGAGLYGLNKWGPLAGKMTGGGNWLSKLGGNAWNWATANKGRAALLGLGAAGMALPFMAGEEEEIIEEPWETTPSSIANIRDMARNRDSSLAFLPSNAYAQAGYYLADGGRAGLLNGGGAGQAQAEQMLKMQYQKYRNQGGTMSYQQFKMQVLKQAQQRGPMAQQQAQAQPQMAAKGGRIGLKGGSGGIKDFAKKHWGKASTVAGGALWAPDIADILQHMGFFNEGGRVGLANGGFFNGEDLEQKLHDLADYYMERGLSESEAYETAANKLYKKDGGRVGLANGGVPGSHVAGYTTPAAYNKFDYPSGGVRVAAAEGGIMPLLDLGGKEKDYRQDGGFVGIGRKEKADDVPARLSKNEFVFTADAVRNAGGGDIDAGAEVMENLMNNLEQGGQISQESQGLGGEEMISEEEMIEAPDGAQEMYEQQAMLQSRMG